MKRLMSIVIAVACGVLAQAQIVSTPRGAVIAVNGMTTEITVCSPTEVRVTKYVGARPSLSAGYKLSGKTSVLADSLSRTEAAGKLKVDTGRFYAAVNAKDGNVSFWDHDGNLILAEQHSTGKMTPVDGKTGKYDVRQDFQIGKSEAAAIYCPTVKSDKRVNLKGQRTKFGDKKSGLPKRMISTDKGYSIYWNTSGQSFIDDTPGRDVKKPGDVTLSATLSPAIDYYFILD